MGIRQLGALLFPILVAASARPALANVKLPALFGDNMVLQRNMNVPVWGTADPGEGVTVTIGDQKVATTADDGGKWSVRLAPLQAALDLPDRTGVTLTVVGKNTVTLRNVAVGEVWVCSGQSNMEFALRTAVNAEQEIAAANNPQIRMFTVWHGDGRTASCPRRGAVAGCYFGDGA